ncbi:MAG: glycosyltransferase [Syntrophorhabdales bacterium]
MNVYLLSQHNLGVGHLSRTSLLAGEIAKIPGASVMHISCGPSTEIVLSQPGVSLVELPPLIVKGLSSTELVPAEEGKKRQEVEKERVSAIKHLLEARPPAMFITEFFPFSPHRLDGTLMPILRLLKREFPECAIVCSSRDIPVCHGERLPAEKVELIGSVLNTYYDLLLVHSDPAVLRLDHIPKLRALRASCPIVYTGYICERRSAAAHPVAREGEKRILVTIGGGRDGHRLIDCAIRAATLKKEYSFDIVCGPFMEEGVVKAMSRKVARLANVRLHWHVRNLKEAIAEYDLVICKGGYNTLMETIVRRKRCISVPRKGSYEQGKRVSVFFAKGLLVGHSETRLTAKRLSGLIDEAFASDYQPAFRINTEGLKHTVSILQDALASRIESTHERIA